MDKILIKISLAIMLVLWLGMAAGEYLTIFKDEGVTYVNFFGAKRKEINLYHEEVEFWTYLPKKVTER